MSATNLCKICNINAFKYSCPKCNIVFCSLACYKSENHLKCSEEFYKKCVEDEISATGQPTDDIKKMYDILNRLSHQFEEDDFNLDAPEPDLDSDDDNDEEDEIDMAYRLEGIDINDSDEIWNRLTESEKKDFQSQIENGELVKLLPKYTPWWSAHTSKLVVPISEENIPKVCENIPPFSSICSKEPLPCVHNNLWNVIAAYASTVRFFNGEHHTNSREATKYYLALSNNLKKNVNFDDAEQAVTSIKMEALAENVPLPCDDFSQLQNDCRLIMSGGLNFKLAALSDTIRLFKTVKDQNLSNKFKQKSSEFRQKFEEIIVSDLTRRNLNLIIKKIEFLLSFVKSDLQR